MTTPFPGNILARAFAVALQRNGDIVAVGQTALTDTGSSDFALVRYNPDGSVDTTFGNSGFVNILSAYTEDDLTDVYTSNKTSGLAESSTHARGQRPA